MTDRDPQAPPGGMAEQCRECGASLAADQRYCLNCGRRRGEPRLDFRRYGPGERATGTPQGAAPAPAPATAPPADERPQRDFAPLAAAGGIAVLGLMLLVGVLIGRGDGNASAPAPPPVVRVEGDGGAAAASDEAGATGGGGLKLDKPAQAKGGKGGGGGEKAPDPAITASESELEALQEQSPQEYSESSAKLPNEIATPGEAPPTDDKAPGAGSRGTAIE
jgi:hypothetical protein